MDYRDIEHLTVNGGLGLSDCAWQDYFLRCPIVIFFFDRITALPAVQLNVIHISRSSVCWPRVESNFESSIT
jgi:hypothetical protein